MTIIAAADGSALGNPGAAGWAWFIDDERWRAGGWEHATNNRAELMAVLSLLRETEGVDEPLHVFCDSQYVINSLTKWLPGWKRRGWRKADGKPVMNRELLEQLDDALATRPVTFEWVKGHTGHTLNERADLLARSAAIAFQRGEKPHEGPGFAESPAHSPTPLTKNSTEPSLFDLLDPQDRGDIRPDRDDIRAGRAAATSDVTEVLRLENTLFGHQEKPGETHVGTLLHRKIYAVTGNGRTHRSPAEFLAHLLATPDPSHDVEVTFTRSLTPDLMQVVARRSGRTNVSTVSLWERGGSTWSLRFYQETPVV